MDEVNTFDDATAEISIELERPIVADGQFDTIFTEQILVWDGPSALVLAAPPRVI